MTDTTTMPRAVEALALALEMLNRINAADDDRNFLTEDEAVCTIMAIDELDAALRAALGQPQGEQEPVAWMNAKGGTTFDPYRASCWRDSGPVTPLYTHPQPKRQPLTDAQINDHRLALPYDGGDLPDPWDFKQGVRAAERAHRIGGEE